MTTNSTENVIFEIVNALAAAEDVEPGELEYTLPQYFNPEALVNMLDVDDTAWEFTVQVPRHEVTVTHAGEIFIDGARYGHIEESSQPQEMVDEYIRESLPYSQTLLNNLPCLVYRCEYQRTWPMQFISGNCQPLTGYDPNAFVIGGVSFGEDVIHAADQQPVWNGVQDSLRTSEGFSQVHRIRTADGAVKPVWNRGVGVVGAEDVIALVGFVTIPPTNSEIHSEEFEQPLRT